MNISESIILKFNCSDSFIVTTTMIYKYRLHWVCVHCWHQTHTIRNMFDPFRKILINDSSYSTRIIPQNLQFIAALKKKEKDKQSKHTTFYHLLLVRILVFIRDSYLFCAPCIRWVMKSRNQHQHHTCC